ncbi:MBOAT family protein [Eubacterium sp. MSJ-21]|nr:MBOAT family protein [Eubacterium sp. MSJ-21]
MAYHEAMYFLLFLPAVIICYQLIPQKFRWSVLLFFGYAFYIIMSRKLVFFLLGATGITYGTGCLLGYMKKKAKTACSAGETTHEEKKKIKSDSKRKQKKVLVAGIGILLLCLIYMKYSGFLVENINVVLNQLHIKNSLTVKTWILPLGISFYTLSAIGYLVDVYWEKIPYEKHFGKFALFLGYFPVIMEGPICMYEDISKELAEGKPVQGDWLIRGYLRIVWGIFKKSVIADRLYIAVSALFDHYTDYSGVMIIAAAVFYAVQLYMEFSGSMDIIIGSSEIFGVHLPENFAQPFVSANASEFWRRWHISLGRWFKTYIFYPVSMSKLAKRWNKFAKKHTSVYVKQIVASAIALFPVWICNGLWHGPRWSYIFYGLYYFTVILIELMLEQPFTKLCGKLSINKNSGWCRRIRILKTWVIIFTGELFFRADTLQIGMHMFRSMFHQFHISQLWDGTLYNLGLDKADWIVILAALSVVGIVNHLRERKVDLREKIMVQKLPARWAVYMCLILAVVIFGAYGLGYQEVDLIYAGF